MISDVIANQLADTFQLVHSDAEEIAQYLANGEPVLVAEIAVMTLSGNALIISAPDSPEASPNREPGEGEEENPGERTETDDPGSFKIKIPLPHATMDTLHCLRRAVEADGASMILIESVSIPPDEGLKL